MVEFTHLVDELNHQSTCLAELCKPPHFTVQASYKGWAGSGKGKIKHLAHSGRCCSRWIARTAVLVEIKYGECYLDTPQLLGGHTPKSGLAPASIS